MSETEIDKSAFPLAINEHILDVHVVVGDSPSVKSRTGFPIGLLHFWGLPSANCHPFTRHDWMFMHNGQMATLEEVVKHYSEVSPDRLHSDGTPLVRALGLSEGEKADLVTFLRSLDSDMPKPAPPPALCP